MRYVPALDGVRGSAIVAVLLYHAGKLEFGWIGVQLFFVLSGFLITTILLEQIGTERLRDYLLRFWWRRSLRIFPIYLLYLAILATFWMVSRVPRQLEEYWPHLVTYTYNFATIGNEGHRAYSHVWSLCVEEQFYLAWPFVVWICNRKQLKIILLLMVFTGPVMRASAVLIGRHLSIDDALIGEIFYYASPFYLETFAFGASLAVWRPRGATRRVLVLGPVLFTGCGLLNCVLGNTAPSTLGYPRLATIGYEHLWSYTVINFLSACLIAAALRPDNTVARLLSGRSITYLGRISYGLYLYHNGVFTLVRQLLPLENIRFGFDLMVVAYLGGSVACAAASYRWIERPLLGLKKGEPRGSARKPGSLVLRGPGSTVPSLQAVGVAPPIADVLTSEMKTSATKEGPADVPDSGS